MWIKILGFVIGVLLKRIEKNKNEKLEGDLMMYELFWLLFKVVRKKVFL